MAALTEPELRVLEQVHQIEEAGGVPTISDLRSGSDDASAVERAARRLQDLGLLRRGSRLVVDMYLTADGSNELAAMMKRRADRGARRAACREVLLRWVDSNTESNAGSRISREEFRGSMDLVEFSAQEVGAAAAHLATAGLVGSLSVWGKEHLLVWIEELGRDCVDSDMTIAEFLRQRNQAIGGNAISVTGDGNTIAAASGVANVVTADSSSFDPDAARAFAQAVREALPALNLEVDVSNLLDHVEQPDDPSLARRATAELYRLISASTTGALGSILGAAGAQALGIGS